MAIITCSKCGQQKQHQAKGLCYKCYKKFAWRSKTIICKRCGKEKPFHAKDLCGGCYNFVFHLDGTKARNYKKWYGLSPEVYKKLTQACAICGFDKVVDLHHLDQNKKNNSESNLIGLCPNHHKMLHDFRYREEMRNTLKDNGFKIENDFKLNFNK